MDIQALQSNLRAFAAARDWQPFHTPKNFSIALMVEAAELAEIFQWMTPQESQAAHLNPDTQERIADEVADVLLYLLQLADHCAIDVEGAVAHKVVKNGIKHPPVKLTTVPVHKADAAPVPRPVVASSNPDEISARTKPPGSVATQTHVLVDWENVQPKDKDIQTLVPGVTDVWLFHGPHQRHVSVNQTLFGEHLTLVPIARAGSNALDFHLSFYMGYIASRSPEANFVVISNDTGYLPMLEHAQILGFSVQQVEFRSQRQAVKPTSATAPVAVKKTVVAKKTQPAKPAKPPVPAQPKAVAKPVAAVPAKKMAASKKVAAPKKAAAVLVAATVSANSDNKTKVFAKKATAKKTPVIKASAPIVPPKQPSQTDIVDKAVRHVWARLKKMDHKPTRKLRLLAVIKSLLGEPVADTVMVSEVLTKLVEDGLVAVDEKGGVQFRSAVVSQSVSKT